MPISSTDAERRAEYRRALAASDQDQTPPTTRRATPQARRERPNDDAGLARHLDRQPASSDYVAFLSGVSRSIVADVTAVDAPSRDDVVRAKLDAVRDAFSGPYLVDGRNISARPMFRMTTHPIPAKLAIEVDVLGLRAGVRAPIEARVGQCTPRDLVRITQALIDAGRLPPRPEEMAMRIRQMQWSYGIGVDCAGYAKQALAAISSRALQFHAAGSESFRDPDRDRPGSFAKVPFTDARAGDLLTLDGLPRGAWGHNVVVYSHVAADTSLRATLGASSDDVRAFFASAGPHHVFEVDSSWGAGGNGDEVGGYRRDTWIYDASSKTWGSFLPGMAPRLFTTSKEGPAGDRYHGTYRPR